MRRLIFMLLFCLILVGFVSIGFAEENESFNNITSGRENGDLVDKAYQCLEDEVDDKSSFSLEEAVFGVLALGSNDDLIDTIKDEKKSGQDCWPKSGCTLTQTSEVLLAYDKIGKDTEGIEDWLKSKASSAVDLTWYLEIDIQNHVPATCKVTYDGSPKTININEDLTLSGSGGSCLSLSNSNYWLKISNTCLDKEFEVSCDEDFITTLLYRKGASGTLFVSSETHSASSLGTTIEKVDSECLKSGTSCDYEGTLWGALALNKKGEDVDSYLPYLLALSSDNKKYFPNAFLYIINGGQEQFNEVIQSQKQGKYWEIVGSVGNRFYDTALGMLSLSGSGATELGNAQSYLLEIQTKEGCWNNNNVRDTAFILYSGWPRGVSGGGSSGSGGGSCLSTGKYCVAQYACLESNGIVFNEYDCSNFREVCCSVNVVEQTCAEKSGILCGTNQRCDGSTTSSLDGTCCLDSCVANVVENVCESFGGNCRNSCLEDEEENSDSCPDSGEVCCEIKTTSESSSSLWIWIAILVVLIILVVAGIIYRNKIRTWWFKRRGKISTSPAGPKWPPGGMMMSRSPSPRFGTPRRAPPRSSFGGEIDETMRKLREMSK